MAGKTQSDQSHLFKFTWPLEAKLKKKKFKKHSSSFSHAKWFLELPDEYMVSKYLILTSENFKSQKEVISLLKDKI